ncbi:MAG: CNNM domain-containing protein [Hydrogenophilus sp.]|nr:CNNM domain-containing protein [Hydrogenophilus sp.]
MTAASSNPALTISLWHILALALLLLLSALASMSETVMMAANRYRLKAEADAGHRGAKLALQLLADTDRLLSTILLINNIVNIGAATLASLITLALFGEHESALALGSLLLTFLILIFSEITPKIIGARHATRLAVWFAFPLAAAVRFTAPLVTFTHLFVRALLKILRLDQPPRPDRHATSPDELRAIVQQVSFGHHQHHRNLLLNLLDLESLTVADLMRPRAEIEAIDLSAPTPQLAEQIATAYHSRLPLIDRRSEEIVGVVHLKRLLAPLLAGEPFDKALLTTAVTPPYYVPADTPVLQQLDAFRAQRERLALVIDEYGELQGLITVDDILAEVMGHFNPILSGSGRWRWGPDGTVTVEGSALIREVNRVLALDLPEEPARTLNGLLLAHLQTLPDGEVAVRFGNIVAEAIQSDARTIRVIRLRKLQ